MLWLYCSDNIDNKYYIYPESLIINRVTTNYHGGYIGVRTHGYFLSCLIPIIGSQWFLLYLNQHSWDQYAFTFALSAQENLKTKMGLTPLRIKFQLFKCWMLSLMMRRINNVRLLQWVLLVVTYKFLFLNLRKGGQTNEEKKEPHFLSLYFRYHCLPSYWESVCAKYFWQNL